MNASKLTAVVVAAAGIGLIPVLLVLAPPLRSDRDALAARVDERVERARRMLDRYDGGLERLAVVSDALEEAGFTLNVEGDAVGNALEKHSAVVDEAAAQIRTLTAAWPEGPVTLSRGSELERAARTGLTDRAKQLSSHAKLLDAAYAELRQGLDASLGEARGDAGVAGKTLEAAMLYQKGAAALRQAALLRTAAEAPRLALRRAAHDVNALSRSRDLVSASEIDEKIAAADGIAAEFESQVKALTGLTGELSAKIATLSKQVEMQKSVAEQARHEMESTEDECVDLATPGAMAAFAERYAQLADTYAEAVSLGAALENGTLKNAKIDASGDYLAGAYIPAGDGEVSVDRGLAGFKRDLAAAQVELTQTQEAFAAARASSDSLKQIKSKLQKSVNSGSERIAALRSEAQPIAESLVRVIDAAIAAEDVAVQKLNASVAAAGAAASLANAEVNDASSRLNAMTSEEAKQRSTASLVSTHTTIPGHRQAQKADAQMLLGQVYYQRYRDADLDSELWSAVGGPLGLSDAEATAARFATLRDESRKSGNDVLEAAITGLEQASRLLREHWSVRAQIGGATYLLSLFGDPDETLRNTAIANYESAVEAVQAPELAGLIAPYKDRIRQLSSQ